MQNTPVDVAEDVLPVVDTDDQEMLGVRSVGPSASALVSPVRAVELAHCSV
jgi:hypothetical protein